MEGTDGSWWLEETIDDLRASIDRCDTSLMQMLSERLRVYGKLFVYAKIKGTMPDVREQFFHLVTDENLGQPFFPSLDFWEEIYTLLQQVEQELIESIQDKQLPELYRLETKFDLAEQMESADWLVIKTMIERFRVVWRVGQYKKNMEQQPLAPERWQQILDDKAEKARALGLPSQMVMDLYNTIHAEALTMQEGIRAKVKAG